MIAAMNRAEGRRSEIFAPGMLSGRVALVTGGGTGLGRATALELARCGAQVTIAGRRGEVLEEAAAEINSRAGAAKPLGKEDDSAAGDAEAGRGNADSVAGDVDPMTGKADWVAGDVREREDANRLVETVLERHGRLDLLVNNAGGQYFTPAEAIAGKGWAAVWRLNVEGALNMAEAAFELAFEPAGGGTVVNVTLSPHNGMPGMAHSGSARATVEALTRELATLWAPAGVAVTAVAAGVFETEALAKYPANVRAGAARTVPLQRLGEVAEHAWLVALLASPLGRAFNGSTVTLDGARDNWAGPWPPAGLADESGEVPREERR
jgi:citronellol/citronellal dehydrogenase